MIHKFYKALYPEFKEWFKRFIIVCAAASIGLLLLLVVYCIPTEPIIENVKESIAVFEEEGVYPDLITFSGIRRLDNWTDARMIQGAAYDGDKSLIDRALKVYSLTSSESNPTETLIGYYSGNLEAGTISYARYWHGYMVYLKPLLYFFNYQQIRILNGICIILTIILLLGLMWKRKLYYCIIPYLLFIWSLTPRAIACSLQFSSVYYIFTIASAVLLYKADYFKSVSRGMWLFLFIGCATSYFDFLTYPLVTFGIPAIFYFCIYDQYDLKEVFDRFFRYLLAWGFGYVVMWAMKWIFATVLTDQNVIANALENVMLRSSFADQSGIQFSIIDPIIKNYTTYAKSFVFYLSCIFILLQLFIILFCKLKNFKVSQILVFIVIGLLPVIWYIGASNHSMIHFWFTYRTASISLFSIMCLASKYGAFSIDNYYKKRIILLNKIC